MLQSLPSEAEDLVDKLPTDQEAAAFPEVVRTKTFVLEPMTLEDALEQVPSHYNRACTQTPSVCFVLLRACTRLC